MSRFICMTCGTQYPESEAPPAYCPVCLDDRQYLGQNGQQWTTLEDLRVSHHNVIKQEEAALNGIGTHPDFGIAQRALLVQTPGGNLLWDCISLLDDPTVAAVRALGGIRAVAISHPHYYSSMVEWAHTFDAPIYLHEEERPWVMRPDDAVEFWGGDTKPLFGGLTLIRCGGHFPGAQVAHWPAGADGKGVLLSGDILTVVSDRRYVSFMYSYPNLIPLPAASVRAVVDAVRPFPFDRIYGAWWGRVVANDGMQGVEFSAKRYIDALEGRHPAGWPPRSLRL
jgi:hypothetical protein